MTISYQVNHLNSVQFIILGKSASVFIFLWVTSRENAGLFWEEFGKYTFTYENVQTMFLSLKQSVQTSGKLLFHLIKLFENMLCCQTIV